MSGRRGRTSTVWAHFSGKEGGGICNLCKKFVVGAGGNTSNLARHLKTHHQIEVKKVTLFTAWKQEPGKVNDGQQPSTSGALLPPSNYRYSI